MKNSITQHIIQLSVTLSALTVIASFMSWLFIPRIDMYFKSQFRPEVDSVWIDVDDIKRGQEMWWYIAELHIGIDSLGILSDYWIKHNRNISHEHRRHR